MTAQLLNGKDIAKTIQNDIQTQLIHWKTLGYRAPALAVILIGNDPASEVYVRNKHQACQKVGIQSRAIHLETSITQEKLLTLISELNNNPDIDGILVQLPLPSHIDSQAIIESIHPKKDVDGFHPYNLGRLAQRKPLLRPCTPAGIMELLAFTKLPLVGLNATVIGVSNIVGRPMLLELLMAGCTVTACHSHTVDLPQWIKGADILIAAAGKPGLVKGEWIKQNAIVIDVGMNRLESGRFVGDVEFEEAAQKASFITPVPGGVGPMTVAVLLRNTVYAYKFLYLGQST